MRGVVLIRRILKLSDAIAAWVIAPCDCWCKNPVWTFVSPPYSPFPIPSTREISQCVKLAREHGATTIGLIGHEGAASRFCDIELLVEILGNTDLYTPTISPVAALVVIDMLSTYVALLRSPEQDRKSVV